MGCYQVKFLKHQLKELLLEYRVREGHQFRYEALKYKVTSTNYRLVLRFQI